MTYPSVEVTSTPVDLVATLTLPDGNYTIQNIGVNTMFFAQKDTATAEATLKDDEGHLLSPLFRVSRSDGRMSVAGDLSYVWCNDGKTSRVVVSDAI